MDPGGFLLGGENFALWGGVGAMFKEIAAI